MNVRSFYLWPWLPEDRGQDPGLGNVGVQNTELVSELILELIGDPDGCPLTDTANATSGHVTTVAHMSEPIACL